jgi:N-dimethylarginine dimethylaminohydrolase
VIGDIIVLNPNGIEKGFSPYLFTNKVVEVSLSEQFYLPTNFLTISPNTIIANKECKRTNLALKNLGVKIEEVSFKEMVKLGGSFRCCSIELLKE